jgi:hypothetical protein
LERVLEKLGEFLGNLEEGFLWVFRFFERSVIFGAAVMARRTGRQDRGM